MKTVVVAITVVAGVLLGVPTTTMSVAEESPEATYVEVYPLAVYGKVLVPVVVL